MSVDTIKGVNEVLVKAGRLHLRPICVYGSESVPDGAVQVSSVITQGHKCLAKALLKMAMHEDVPAVYLGKDALKGCCFGASAWLGVIRMPPMMKNMYSYVPKGDGNHIAQYLKSTPESCNASLTDLGQVTPPGKYIVMQACADMDGDISSIRSILCFGDAEQIRNLCGLVHFGEEKAFSPIIAPWGSHCASFVTYPAGMAENAPKDTAFLGPMMSYGNDWFPRDMMSLGIPAHIAARMCRDYERSFAALKPEVTYASFKEKL
jgi:hypothetical protein